MSLAASHRPLPQALRAAAAELVELTALSERQQALIVDLASRVQLSDAQIHDLQGADFLTQHLQGLERFLSALVDSAPDGCAFDGALAVAGLSLTAQARRLSGLDLEGAGESGDLALFGD